jgi:hypothetical protein
MISARGLWLGILTVFCMSCAVCVFGSAAALAAPPTIEGESFSDVGSSSATLGATVNVGGSLTSYRFEYGTSVAYGSTTRATSAGSGASGVSVLAQLEGLQPETVYHFRAVATNASSETGHGADETFTTLPVGLLGLPDDRGYELVSPVNNADGDVYEPKVAGENDNGGNGDNTERPFQAAADGDAIAYVGDPSATGGSGSEGNGFGNEYMSVRSPEGDWTAQSIEPPIRSYGSEEPAYQAFSSNLAVGFLAYDGASPLTDGGLGESYSVLYSRASSNGAFAPFFTTKPPHRHPGGFEAYEVARHTETAPVYAGSSANLEHLLFIANDSLTPLAEQVPPEFEENDLYDSIAGKLYLVNVLPDGTPEPDAIFGSPVERSEEENPERDSPDFSHVISEDGSRIFWTDLHTDILYVREYDDQPQSPVVGGKCTVPADACTVQIDLAEPGAGASGGGRFWAADGDGSKVFFTDENKLTANSTAETEEPDLYECELVQEAGESKCRLTDLTVDAGGHASVQGVIGASETGSYVYFVADGVLGNGAEKGATTQRCEQGNARRGCNLYVLHEGEAPRFIATLSGDDDYVQPLSLNNAAYGDWRPGLGNRTAEMTPDGKQLVFMSERNLTGYESDGQQEVYIYDREGDGGQGELSCVSCNPSGEPPSTTHERTGGEGTPALWSAFLQPSYSNTYLPRWMSTDGERVFFDSYQALVPQATNARINVYEWEREGAEGGSCALKTPASPSGGCVYLLSGGASTDNSYFVDAGESGDDVFIVTRAKLVPQDESETFALYDARVGAPQALSTPQCSGSGCQGAPGQPPIFATPSSATFNGVGNFPSPSTQPMKPKAKTLTHAQKLAQALKTCKKRSKRKQAACEVQARKRYGARSKAKKSAEGRQ